MRQKRTALQAYMRRRRIPSARVYKRLRRKRLPDAVKVELTIADVCSGARPKTAVARLARRRRKRFVPELSAIAAEIGTWPHGEQFTEVERVEEELFALAESSAHSSFFQDAVASYIRINVRWGAVLASGYLLTVAIFAYLKGHFVGGVGALILTIVLLSTCAALQAMRVVFGRASGICAIGLALFVLMVHLPTVLKDGNLAALNVNQDGFDQLATFALAEVLIFSFSAFGAHLIHLFRNAHFVVRINLIWTGLETLRKLREAEGRFLTLEDKKKLVDLLESLVGLLLSRGHSRITRIKSLRADRVVQQRVRSAADRLRELQVWLALPRPDTPMLVGKEVTQFVAAVTSGMYDYLPVRKDELPSLSRKARVAGIIIKVVVAIAPSVLLLTFNHFGLVISETWGAALHALAIVWFLYWLANVTAMDAVGFASFARDIASTSQNSENPNQVSGR